MKKIKGMTFAPFAKRGELEGNEVQKSLQTMIQNTGSNTVILAPAGIQKTSHSTEINWNSELTASDEELVALINYAHSLGVQVFLKPTANTANGEWRAFISFFENDVPCEPKWSDWFRSYTAFQLHYARIAKETRCEMFIAGCEMVMTEHREAEWRKVIESIRSVYNGPVSYNTDKYQEDHVKWWDCVDVISSSGYYPENDWENQLDRIEKVVNKFQKPFFFAETGCMSTKGSAAVPNNWEVEGEISLEEQRRWYEKAIHAISRRSWIEGPVFWSWDRTLYSKEQAQSHRFYEVYEKPAEKLIAEYFHSL